MSQPRWPESATASPDLLLTQSSQNLGSQPEPTNQDSQVSDSSQIHGMMLKYSDDEVTDEEIRGVKFTNHSSSVYDGVWCSAPDYTYFVSETPLSFESCVTSEHYIPDGQNTWLSQIVHQQPTQLPDGLQGIRLQILYLEEFFDTMWYLIWDDTYGLHAIYDTIFTEIPFFAQLQPFDLVALDTNLQELWDTQINNVRMCTWDGLLKLQIPSQKWWESAPTNQPFPCTMLTHEQRQLIHDDFIKATDFLGTTYRAYEQLITVQIHSNRLDHMANWDKALGKVRNCFKCT